MGLLGVMLGNLLANSNQLLFFFSSFDIHVTREMEGI